MVPPVTPPGPLSFSKSGRGGGGGVACKDRARRPPADKQPHSSRRLMHQWSKQEPESCRRKPDHAAFQQPARAQRPADVQWSLISKSTISALDAARSTGSYWALLADASP